MAFPLLQRFARLSSFASTANTADAPEETQVLSKRRRSASRTRRPRVAYLVNRYPEASQSFIRREIAALERLGVEVERFVVRHWDGQLADEADRLERSKSRAILESSPAEIAWSVGAAVLRRPLAFGRALGLAWKLSRNAPRGFLYHGFYLAEACVLQRWLRSSGISHLHAHFGTNSTTVAMLCHELGGPKFSFTVHGPEEFDRPRELDLATKVNKSEFVVGISNFGKSQLMRWTGFADWNKIHVVHCGVDRPFLDAEVTPVPAARRVVCVGRLDHAKGQSLLVEAAAKLKAEGLDFEIVLAGSCPMYDEIASMIQEFDVADRVRLLGWVSNDQVRAELLASRAMVLPSFAEGLPVAIMEAFGVGRPVVATRVAGIPELVEDRTTGWLIEPGSLGSLVDSLREVFRAAPERLSEMGRRGRRRAQKNHDVESEAAKLLTLMCGQDPDAEPVSAPGTRRFQLVV